MMRLKTSLVFFPLLIILFTSFHLQQTEPWTTNQLMPPGDLAAIINHPATAKPLIISVGPGALIKSSVDIGPANDTANLAKLKQFLATEKKDRKLSFIVAAAPLNIALISVLRFYC